jgi:hypothetical protein
MDSSKIEAIRYDGVIDSIAIRALAGEVDRFWKAGAQVAGQRPVIEASTWDELHDALRRVSQYRISGTRITYQKVPVNKLVSLTRFVREYKYKQIGHMVNLFNNSKLDLFTHAAVRLMGGQKSLITPPVLEQAGSQFLLIEGTTRATYCRDNGLDTMWCAVVQEVNEPPPANRVPFERVRVVSKTLEPEERYPGFNYGAFRHIESSVHRTDSLND